MFALFRAMPAAVSSAREPHLEYRFRETYRFQPRALFSRSLSRTSRGKARWGRHSGTADVSAASPPEASGKAKASGDGVCGFPPPEPSPARAGEGAQRRKRRYDSFKIAELTSNLRTLAAIAATAGLLAACAPATVPIAAADPADPTAKVARIRY